MQFVFRVLSISSGFLWSSISFASPLPPRCSHVMFARASQAAEPRGVTSPASVASSSSRSNVAVGGSGVGTSGTVTVFMWGGFASGTEAASSSMQVGMVEFDMSTIASRESSSDVAVQVIKWRRSQPQGSAGPHPRARCASCISEGTLWIHGGVCLSSRGFGLFGQSEALQNEVCSFDIESQTWLRVVCSGNTAPPALQAHAITPSGTDASILLVFGGLVDSGKPSSSLHSIRTLDESRTLKSPAQFAMESERDDWRIKFIQEAQHHRTILEKFQGTHVECEDMKRRLAFLQTSCVNLERELVSRDEQLLRQRSVIQQMQKKAAQTQEQLENELSQRDAAAASSAAATVTAVQAAAATAEAKMNASGGACELQPHWLSWGWQQLLQANKAIAAAAVATAASNVGKNSTASSVSIDDGDDWLGLGDVLGPQPLQHRPAHNINHSPSASVLTAASPLHCVAVSEAAAGDVADDYCDESSLVIQSEVEAWAKGIVSCDHLGIMVSKMLPNGNCPC
jgi:hypothetical protein